MSKIDYLLAEPSGGYACLHEAIADVLRCLGEDADEVLQAFAAAGVPGWPGHPHMDPLVRWLAQVLPDIGVTLSGDALLVWAGRLDVALVRPPEPVTGALTRVAAGEVPELLLQLEPPAELPGPDLHQLYSDPEAVAAAPVPAGPPPPARSHDTVTIPAVPASDAGGVLVRVAIICGLGAAAAFLLAASGPWASGGAVLALIWPVATTLLLFLRRRRLYLPRHGVGYQPAHAVWAAR